MLAMPAAGVGKGANLARRGLRRSVRNTAKASSSREDAEAARSREVLDAFFFGKAFTEEVAERVGEAIGSAFEEVTRIETETREAVRAFEESIMERARRELYATTGSLPGSQVPSEGEENRAVDLQEAVDELRAETAQARLEGQRARSRQQESGPGA